MTAKTFVQASAIALALISADAGRLSAQASVDAEVAPFVGGNFFLADARAPFVISRDEGAQMMVEDGELRSAAPAVGFSAGLRFADRIGLEGTFAWVPTRMVGPAEVPQRRRVADVRTTRFGISLLYHLEERAHVRPFAGMAVTAEHATFEPHLAWDPGEQTAGSLVLGAHLPFSDRVSARVQAVQDVVGRSDRVRREQLMLTAGLSWRQRVR